MRTFGIIMAGGGGTRFWPLSRKNLPKQFLNLTGKDRMVNETFDRLQKFVDREDIFVVTNQLHGELTEKLMQGRIRGDHILKEPAARNTAACIGYAAMEVLQKYGDGILCILASDHYVRDEATYVSVMQEAVRTAQETDALVTIGIHPEFPSTGYGYILSTRVEGEVYRKVERFVEKPCYETACEYLKDGRYAWNSGMFVWKASTILRWYKTLLPEVYACLLKIGQAMNTPAEQQVLQEVYPMIPKISVDYGIMEKADHVLMLEGDFGWNDIGSFDTLPVLLPADENGNVCRGEHVLLDTSDCICYAEDKLIAAVGVKDLVLVEAGDAILVCPRNRVQDVKKIVEKLEAEGRTEYL